MALHPLRAAHSIAGLLLDEILPPRCGVCGTVGRMLCAACAARLPVALPPRCEVCWQPVSAERCPHCAAYGAPYAAIRAPFAYRAGARRLVTGVKYAGHFALAAEMGARMAAVWTASGYHVDVVMGVPLHPRRQRERGFNQAAVLAREISAATRLPYREDCLYRWRATAPQARTRNDDERRANVYGAFGVHAAAAAGVSGLSVLIVDDVVTTRSTIGACAAALTEAGAATVFGLAFAVAD